MKCSAVIVAAGSGSRMGFDKLLAPVHGKPVLQWSLEAFLAASTIDRIAIVTPEARFSELQFGDDKEVLRVDGGDERFQSVINGLAALGSASPYVAVHDAARPAIRPATIDAVSNAAGEHRAAALAHPVTETLKRAGEDLLTRASVDREGLWVMETPQTFDYSLLQEAYEVVLRNGLPVTDDVSAVEAVGVSTRLVPNPAPNPKVTFPRDLTAVEALLAPST